MYTSLAWHSHAVTSTASTRWRPSFQGRTRLGSRSCSRRARRWRETVKGRWLRCRCRRWPAASRRGSRGCTAAAPVRFSMPVRSERRARSSAARSRCRKPPPVVTAASRGPTRRRSSMNACLRSAMTRSRGGSTGTSWDSCQKRSWAVWGVASTTSAARSRYDSTSSRRPSSTIAPASSGRSVRACPSSWAAATRAWLRWPSAGAR